MNSNVIFPTGKRILRACSPAFSRPRYSGGGGSHERRHSPKPPPYPPPEYRWREDWALAVLVLQRHSPIRIPPEDWGQFRQKRPRSAFHVLGLDEFLAQRVDDDHRWESTYIKLICEPFILRRHGLRLPPAGRKVDPDQH